MGWMAALKQGAPAGNQVESHTRVSGDTSAITLNPAVPLALLKNTSGSQITVTLPDPPKAMVGAIKRVVVMEGTTHDFQMVVSTVVADALKNSQFLKEVGAHLLFVWTGGDEGWAVAEHEIASADGVDVQVS